MLPNVADCAGYILEYSWFMLACSGSMLAYSECCCSRLSSVSRSSKSFSLAASKAEEEKVKITHENMKM